MQINISNECKYSNTNKRRRAITGKWNSDKEEIEEVSQYNNDCEVIEIIDESDDQILISKDNDTFERFPSHYYSLNAINSQNHLLFQKNQNNIFHLQRINSDDCNNINSINKFPINKKIEPKIIKENKGTNSSNKLKRSFRHFEPTESNERERSRERQNFNNNVLHSNL